jgi:murein DD-endopeptidase MepM/ murein hydrolase activator NlpD
MLINLQPSGATFIGESAKSGNTPKANEPQPATAPAPQPAAEQPLIQPPTPPTTEPVAAPAEPAAVVAPPTDAAGMVAEDDMGYLRTRSLLVPVAGVTIGQLRDSFLDGRSEGRTHQALDIMAPVNTPVLATDDGKIMKLFQSDRGGIMVYQSDPSGKYVYYYGHLSRYADGMADGKQVKRGEVIGYVGDTGNAGAGNYHLHFGISKMRAPGRWSGGAPINPYTLLARKQ